MMQQESVSRSSWSTKPYVVLVGMDFSEPALHALRKALAYAAQRDRVELHVACVVPPDTSEPARSLSEANRFVTESAVIEGVFVSLRARIEAELAAFARHLRTHERMPRQVTPHVLLDTPAAGLVELAREIGADVILIGAHGQGPSREALGSVAKSALSLAPCTVILTRALPLP